MLEASTRDTLGKVGATKSDEFSEKFQMAFEPPPHFRMIILQFFLGKRPQKALYKDPKSAVQISGLRMTPCPRTPLWNFSENSSDLVPNGSANLPLFKSH